MAFMLLDNLPIILTISTGCLLKILVIEPKNVKKAKQTPFEIFTIEVRDVSKG
jgi:hypothetical protein